MCYSKHYIYVFGLLGNLMTIVVLCRRHARAAMSCRIEPVMLILVLVPVTPV